MKVKLLDPQITRSRSQLLGHLGVLSFLVGLLAITSFWFIDQPLAQLMGQENMQYFWLLNREITELGDAAPFFFLSVLTYLLVRFLIRPNSPNASKLMTNKMTNKMTNESSLGFFRRINWNWLQTWALLLFYSLCASGITIQCLKFLVGRQRPHKSETFENMVFSPFVNHWDWHSFPSGHSQTLFTVLVFLILVWPRARWIIFTVIAGLALTRALTQAHFLSDVFCGSFIGYSISLLVLHAYSRRVSPILLDQKLLVEPKSRTASPQSGV